MLKSIFIFSFIWSILATVDDVSRKKLNIYFRDKIKDDPENGIPTEKSIYDYYFNKDTKEFMEWSNLYNNFEIENKLGYHEIVVPTNDSTRNIYLKKILLQMRYHVMVCGPTGTGKS
jgi:dynein heavy chain